MPTFAPSYIPPSPGVILKRVYRKVKGLNLAIVEPNQKLPNRIKVIDAIARPGKHYGPGVTHGYLVKDLDTGYLTFLSRYILLRYYMGIRRWKKGKFTIGPASFVGVMPIRNDIEIIPMTAEQKAVWEKLFNNLQLTNKATNGI